MQSSCPPGTGRPYAFRSDVGAHLRGPLDVPRCSPWRSPGSGGVPADDSVAPLHHRFACVRFLESKGRTVDFEQHQRGGTHQGRRRDASNLLTTCLSWMTFEHLYSFHANRSGKFAKNWCGVRQDE